MRVFINAKRFITVLIVAIMMVSQIATVSVRAEEYTTIVMTYEDKVFTKQIYSLDTEQIKAGVVTDGLKSIGELCDNLAYRTNGSDKVDKAAVMEAVKTAIIAGQTSINIDLTKYTPEAMAQSAVVAQAPVATAPTPKTTNPVAEANELLVNNVLNSIGIDCKIAEASTKFNPNQDRAVNVRNAASKINGMILQPGQMISADAAFGSRTVVNGYGMGNVISGGQYVKAMGGGICQVSSTLNLAVLRAGIIPTERHNHSHRSNYIGSGLDATISSGTLDYKFMNTLMYPIYISAVTNGGVLTVSIYSNHAALGGAVYEPKVVGGSLSNTTYLVGKINGVEVSNRLCYGSRYAQ